MGRVKICGALFVWLVMVILGFAAKTSMLTSVDTHLDEHLVSLRSPAFTMIAKAATVAAQAAVGAVIAVIVAAVLWYARRRRDALLTSCLIIGALAIAFITKSVVAEHRPPQRLWVIPPDTKMSFPSGHATVAAAIALALVLVVRGRLRPIAAVAGVAFAGVVAFARLYLGVHYLADVLGGYLAAAGAALLMAGFIDLPAIRRRLEDVGTPATGRHHASRSAREPTRNSR
ncbi:MAG: phosphoesterase, PA-phosphatase related protein [Actinoallomurus sp.]|nr:phosphoesterase, PA-phosphatase related protein [Actinoallomurus sp.]